MNGRIATPTMSLPSGFSSQLPLNSSICNLEPSWNGIAYLYSKHPVTRLSSNEVTTFSSLTLLGPQLELHWHSTTLDNQIAWHARKLKYSSALPHSTYILPYGTLPSARYVSLDILPQKLGSISIHPVYGIQKDYLPLLSHLLGL